MRTLYLHVGLPKTGTTSIQNFIGDNTTALAQAGYHELATFGSGNAWRIAAYSDAPRAFAYFTKQSRRISEKSYAKDKSAFWESVAKEAGKLPKDANVLASSEFIYGFCQDDAVIQDLADKLRAAFDRVVILIFCRQQEKMLKSYFAQNVKGTFRETRPFDEYVRSFPSDYHLFNYAVGVGRWANIFGDENVKVARFDRPTNDGGGVVAKYLDMIGIGDASENDLQQRSRFSNPTHGHRNTELIRALNVAAKRAPMLRPVFDLGRYCLKQRRLNLGGQAPDDTDIYIRDTFGPSNIELGRRFFGKAADPFD